MVLVVEIEDRASPKPFLGGWRDVARDLEYHDATSQTPLEDRTKTRNRVSVPVQTSSHSWTRTRSIAVQGGIERAIQAGPQFPDAGDSLVTVRDPDVLRRLDAAIRIQRFYRAHRSSRRFCHVVDYEDDDEMSRSLGKLEYNVSEDEDDVDGLDEDKSITITEEQSQCASRSIGEFRIVRPSETRVRDVSDYAVLRSLLSRWGIAEESRIRETHVDSESRIAAQGYRLEREIEILRAIESSRSVISRKRQERARAKFLDELAEPIDLRVTQLAKEQQKSRNKSGVRIETMSTRRAREFRDIYEALTIEVENMADNEVDEYDRIELLFILKKVLSQHTCTASTSLENLIDQELFLLASRVKPSRLRHLRSRVRLGFLRLARSALRNDNRIKCPSKTRLCPSCGRLRKLEAFEVDHQERISRRCVDCEALRSRRRREPEVCSGIYERMLKELRRSEAARSDGTSSLAFAVGPKAISYLVNDIWHGRSAISECDDLARLRLVRLDPSIVWSPWNTLLTTRREARMHEALKCESNVAESAYDAELLRKFRRMNLQARLYFENLAKIAESGMSL